MTQTSDIYERAKEAVTETVTRYRRTNFATDMIAEVIVRRLAEEGLLIMDPQPDEDGWDYRTEGCPTCGRVVGTVDGIPTCDNCGWKYEDTDVPEGVTVPVMSGNALAAMLRPKEDATPEQTYKIVRFFFDEGTPTEVITRGLTLEQAQAHCRRDDTHGEGWFDGYESEAVTE